MNENESAQTSTNFSHYLNMPLDMYTVGDFMQHMEYFDKAQEFEGLLRVKGVCNSHLF